MMKLVAVVIALACCLLSSSAFMAGTASVARGVRRATAAPIRMAEDNPQGEEYIEKAKAWAKENSHLSDEEIEQGLNEGRHNVEAGLGSAAHVRKEGQEWAEDKVKEVLAALERNH
ncbi:hypothetical protein JKP88DRAFT_54672 [Tribonema minus]|uniref:Uncharacterized protein n=1 Tax=Tribonema minus TaxID=303371 RepID=A0A835YXB5_9STRA|nr:hypothetical protein JKP88DRAFT_54672 [Tribonema minus]